MNDATELLKKIRAKRAAAVSGDTDEHQVVDRSTDTIFNWLVDDYYAKRAAESDGNDEQD
jgi:hypothetical protein